VPATGHLYGRYADRHSQRSGSRGIRLLIADVGMSHCRLGAASRTSSTFGRMRAMIRPCLTDLSSPDLAKSRALQSKPALIDKPGTILRPCLAAAANTGKLAVSPPRLYLWHILAIAIGSSRSIVVWFPNHPALSVNIPGIWRCWRVCRPRGRVFCKQ
jgi:hypothetical protein